MEREKFSNLIANKTVIFFQLNREQVTQNFQLNHEQEYPTYMTGYMNK